MLSHRQTDIKLVGSGIPPAQAVIEYVFETENLGNFWIVWFGILKTRDIKICFESRLEEDMHIVLFCFFVSFKYSP